MQVSANAGADKQVIAKTAHIGRIIVSHPGFEAPLPTFPVLLSSRESAGMPEAAPHTAQQDRLNAREGPHQNRRGPWLDRF
jgi:hypothetical protein